MEQRLGSTAFRIRTGANNAHVQLMESQGIINPTKTEFGWRQFTEADVQAALIWLAARRCRARAG